MTPEGILPFQLTRDEAHQRIGGWLDRTWFTARGVIQRGLPDSIQKVYLPYWSFSARAWVQWKEEAGYNQLIGDRRARQGWRFPRDREAYFPDREVLVTRWSPSSGSFEHFVQDDRECASTLVDTGLLRSIDAFPSLAGLEPYNAGRLNDGTIAPAELDIATAAERSHRRMDAQITRFCADNVPGQERRKLQVQADYSGQTFTQILLPFWLCDARIRGKSYQVVVNGCTGAVAGRCPRSGFKLSLLALFGTASLGLLLLELTW